MKALVRRPSPRLEEGTVVHIERVPVDYDLAVRQWEQYVGTLRAHGWQIVEAPEVDDCPDGVFIEDAVVMFGTIAVVTRPGTAERVTEPDTVAPIVTSLGATIHQITAPGTLEGGDILKVDSTIYVGRTACTNAEGIRQLRTFLEPAGATVIEVPVTKALHLKSAITALPDATVIGWEPVVDDPSLFDSFLPVPEESGAHVVLIGGNKVLMAADAPLTAALFRTLGFDPIEVDISEFIKLEGCVTCLSVRVRDLDTTHTLA